MSSGLVRAKSLFAYWRTACSRSQFDTFDRCLLTVKFGLNNDSFPFGEEITLWHGLMVIRFTIHNSSSLVEALSQIKLIWINTMRQLFSR